MARKKSVKTSKVTTKKTEVDKPKAEEKPIEKKFKKVEPLKYGVWKIEVLKVEDVTINGRDYKKVYLANGTVEVVTPKDYELQLAAAK